MGMLLITALIAALVSVSRDKNYIRSLEEDNYFNYRQDIPFKPIMFLLRI